MNKIYTKSISKALILFGATSFTNTTVFCDNDLINNLLIFQRMGNKYIYRKTNFKIGHNDEFFYKTYSKYSGQYTLDILNASKNCEVCQIKSVNNLNTLDCRNLYQPKFFDNYEMCKELISKMQITENDYEHLFKVYQQCFEVFKNELKIDNVDIEKRMYQLNPQIVKFTKYWNFAFEYNKDAFQYIPKKYHHKQMVQEALKYNIKFVKYANQDFVSREDYLDFYNYLIKDKHNTKDYFKIIDVKKLTKDDINSIFDIELKYSGSSVSHVWEIFEWLPYQTEHAIIQALKNTKIHNDLQYDIESFCKDIKLWTPEVKQTFFDLFKRNIYSNDYLPPAWYLTVQDYEYVLKSQNNWTLLSNFPIRVKIMYFMKCAMKSAIKFIIK